ncbi:MAG TPA: condensation domain-containing protein, partial [Opitutaceae bacterium]|nr:condensation domain-containing protein [Opitutaceae bacterium]
AVGELRWLPEGDPFRMPGRAARPAAAVAPAPAPPAFAAPEGEAERLLAGLWAELLRAPRIGRQDNFFALGGDSIIALQVAARAASAGWTVPAQAVFTRQTLAELAGAAAPKAAGDARRGGEEAGAILLTPIQRWFFELGLAQPDHWNQSMLLVTPPDFDLARCRAALEGIAARHEGLRLRYRQGPAGWGVSREGSAGGVALEVRPLPDLAAGIAAAQGGLSLAEGPLLRAVYFEGKAGGEGRLFLAAHHVAIDGVSWRILLDDLTALYAGGFTAPAPDWSAWAREVAGEALRPEVAAQLDFWRGLAADPPLPRDFEAAGRGRGGDESTVVSRLPAEGTGLLLRELGAVHRAHIDEILAGALFWALREWTGREALTLAIERHGREELGALPAPAETLGWFTNLHPVRIAAAGERSAAAAVRDAKEALRGVPAKGIGYGLLRYLGPADARAVLGSQPWPELCFNYLGRFEGSASGGFRAAPEARGVDRHPANARPFLIEINAGVQDGILECGWTYSRAHHRPETIFRLADRFTGALTQLIAGGGALAAPSDFSAGGLSQSDLEKVLSRLR